MIRARERPTTDDVKSFWRVREKLFWRALAGFVLTALGSGGAYMAFPVQPEAGAATPATAQPAQSDGPYIHKEVYQAHQGTQAQRDQGQDSRISASELHLGQRTNELERRVAVVETQLVEIRQAQIENLKVSQEILRRTPQKKRGGPQ